MARKNGIISLNKIIDAEQFKKACLILNEFITNIKQIIPSNADIIKNKLKENIKNLNLMLKSNISLITFQPKYFDNYFFDKIKTDELDIHIIYFSSKKSDFENELKKTIKIKKYKYYQFIKGQNDEEKKKNY